MINKTMAILATWIFIATTSVHGQTGSHLSGKISVADNKPAQDATVELLKEADSAIFRTTMADLSGSFIFNNIPKGKYELHVTLTGYEYSMLRPVNVYQDSIVLPAIILKQSPQVLKDITVTAKKPLIVNKPGKIIVNADAMLSAAGGTAMDVLDKSPGIQVDQNGIISLKGKQGVTIYIDDKPTYLSGAALDTYLRSLSSSAIDQIEIMSNPPARYDAAGNAGIINIRTKRNNVKGINGGINLALTQGKKTRSNNSFNLNYRNNKISSFANFSYNLNNSFTDLDLNRMYKNADNSPSAYFEQNSYFKRHGNTFTLKTGADYYQSEKNTLGIVLTGMARKSSQWNDNSSLFLNSHRNPDSIITANNKDDIDFKNGGINLNFRRQIDQKGHELTMDADYLVYRNNTIQQYNNYSYSPEMVLRTQDILSGKLPARLDIYSFKTDYTKPLADEWKLSAGLKSSYTKNNNTADYTTTVNNITRPDYDKSNHFIYKENINAAYLNLNKEMKQWSVQGGLRIENTISDGHQLGNIMKPDSTFKKNYTNAFPTLYLSYKLDTLSRHQLAINYGRRVDRPYYEDLNPFLYPMDKFTYYSGNPFLKPSFTQSIELSHTYRNKITTTLTYARTRDDVNETIEIRNGIYYSKPGNIGLKTQKTISVDADFDFTKWLNLHVYTEFTNAVYEGSFFTGKIRTNGSYFFISPIARIKLGNGWDGELSGNYRSKATDAQFIVKSFGQLNLALQKKLSSRITLKFSASDLFRNRVIIGTITNLNMAEAGWVNRSDSRNATLSLSYRFGKIISGQRKHENNGAESEKNRVKQ